MKPYGLLGAGAVSRSFLARLPNLTLLLGSVASTSYRLASRIAHGLRAGTPLREIDYLASSEIILFCAPGGKVRDLAHRLAKADINWQGKIILFCDSEVYSSTFPYFRESGAAAGSLNPIKGTPNHFVVEGDRLAVREMRNLVRLLHGKAVEVSCTDVLYYEASLTLATSLFTPLLESSVECFRRSGMENSEAMELMGILFSRSIRAYQHAGRKSWSGPVAQGNSKAIDQQEKALKEGMPLLAKYFQHAAEYAFALYQTFPELTRHNKTRWKETIKGSLE